MLLKYNTMTLEIMKCTLMSLIVTCLSVSADPLKQKPQSLNFSPTTNSQRQEANEVKPDFIPIYIYARENSLDGDYNFRYETGNGIFAEERGVMLNKGTENEANSVVGSYKYVSPEGVPIEVSYTAGVEGFRAYGAHLPVGPSAAASYVPKNLSFKNAATNAFARPPQFKTVDGDPSMNAVAEYRSTPVAQHTDGEDRLAPSPQNAYAPSPAEAPEQVAAANEAEHPEIILLQAGTEKPASDVVPTAGNPAERPRDTPQLGSDGTAPEYYQRFQLPTVSENRAPHDHTAVLLAQASQPAAETPTKHAALVFQTGLRAVPSARPNPAALPPTAPRTAVPAYQPQPTHQHFYPRPPHHQLPAFNQQQRPGQVIHQFSVEPQQMRYVPHDQSRGRRFQTPPMRLTLEPPKY